MKRDLRDVIPTGPSWRPAEIDNTRARDKRKVTNEKASRARGAVSSDIVVGDKVIMKDRHLEWKFRTPFEREVWTVAEIKGTMIMVKRNPHTVTQNMSWFKRVHSNPLRTEDASISESELPLPVTSENSPMDAGPRVDMANTRDQSAIPQEVAGPEVRPAETTSQAETRIRSQRYSLRPNPAPSQKFKDFCRTTTSTVISNVFLS